MSFKIVVDDLNLHSSELRNAVFSVSRSKIINFRLGLGTSCDEKKMLLLEIPQEILEMSLADNTYDIFTGLISCF